MTKLQKQTIVQLIAAEKERLGSFAKVATKAGVSGATITQMNTGNWQLIKDEMWLKVGQSLGYTESNWQIADTIGYRKVSKICNDGRNHKLFMIVADKAGIGKSASLRTYVAETDNSSVFYLCAREWAKRDFLLELCQTLGIDAGKSYAKVDQLGMKVVNFFKKRSADSPQLIIDEADKLRDSALRWFIHLFNECEDEMSLIIAGTPHLEQRITRGVRLKKLGFDELESRFGRSYISLIGATQECVAKICSVNGLTDVKLQKQIFQDLKPTYKEVAIGGGQVTSVKVVEDLRRLKRIVIREKLKINGYGVN